MECKHIYCQNEVKGPIKNGVEKNPRQDKKFCQRSCKENYYKMMKRKKEKKLKLF